jgi:hypothetical protein
MHQPTVRRCTFNTKHLYNINKQYIVTQRQQKSSSAPYHATRVWHGMIESVVDQASISNEHSVLHGRDIVDILYAHLLRHKQELKNDVTREKCIQVGVSTPFYIIIDSSCRCAQFG